MTTCAMHSALDGLVSLLEGVTGAAACCIAANQFARVDPHVDDLRVAPTSRPYPFNLRGLGLVQGSEELGDLTSGSMMRGAHSIELHIAYPARPHADFDLVCEIADDLTQIRAVVEYEPNIDLTADWAGCYVVGAETRDVDDDDGQPLLRVLVLSLELRVHDERTT